MDVTRLVASDKRSPALVQVRAYVGGCMVWVLFLSIVFCGGRIIADTWLGSIHRRLIPKRTRPSHPPNPQTKQFQSVEAAVHACILLHNQEVNGNVLYVTFSDADGL